MDIEKMIVSLRSHSCQDVEDVYVIFNDYASTAIYTLQAENDKLRAELEQVKRENETLKHALQNWHEEG